PGPGAGVGVGIGTPADLMAAIGERGGRVGGVVCMGADEKKGGSRAEAFQNPSEEGGHGGRWAVIERQIGPLLSRRYAPQQIREKGRGGAGQMGTDDRNRVDHYGCPSSSRWARSLSAPETDFSGISAVG